MDQERGQTARIVDASIVDGYCADERKLLHDKLNPLAIAIGMLESVIEDGNANATLSEMQTCRLDKANGAIERMKALLRLRRAEIIAA